MIQVTRLNKTEFLVNPDLIEFIEETPNTVITLSTGVKIVVVESAQELADRIVEYRRRIYRDIVDVSKYGRQE